MQSTSSKRRLAASASVFAILATAIPTLAPAATCVWNTTTGSWATGADWSCGVQPGAGDDVVITSAGAVVNITGINADAGTVNLGTGNALNVNNSNFFIHNNAITNNGTVTLSNVGSLISGSGTVTIGGTGTITLDDTSNVARIYSGGFVFGSGQTLNGSGQIGINTTIVTNNGLISASVNGRGIDLDVTGGNGGVGAGNGVGTNGNAGLLNTGIMQAANGGTLSFEGGLYENSGTGVIKALAGSAVALNADSRILNGTLTSVGTGVIDAHGVNQYLNNVTLSSGSNLDVNNDNLFLNTTFANNGTVKLSTNASLINETGALAITGAGTIQLDNSGGFARIYGGSITFGSGQSITGSGQLGINQTIITNNNLFSVGSGGGLDIDVTGGNGGVGVGNGVGTNTNSALLNNGVIQATGGSTLYFEGGLYENAVGGVIRAVNGSTINLNADSRILNGTLTADATSVINAHGVNQYLTNVSLSSASNLDVNNDNLFLNTTFTNNGTVKLSNNASLINETGALAINGAGTIILDSTSGFARIYGGNITFGAGETVQGAGSLGINQTTFTINNVFSANAGSTLDIDVTGGNGGLGGGGVGTGNNSGLLNNSTIQATGGSSLSFEGGLYENAANGVIQALNGSTINLNADSRILNGTLTTAGTGVVNAHGVTQYLSNVTLSSGSNLDVNNDNLYLNTTFTNNGTVKVSVNSNLIDETGALTFQGAGTIQLDSSGGYARIYGGTITFGSGQSITGSGQLGINQTIITNNNLFSVGNGGGLDIDVTGGNGGVGVGNGVGTNTNSALLNNGVIQATGGSTLYFEGGLYENAVGGVMRAVNGSTINLNADSRILNGTLTADATSVINAHGVSQYLSNVTLSSGSNLDVNSDNLYLNTTFTNNGTVKVSGNSNLINETGALAINGAGTIILDSSGGYARIYGGNITFGAGETVQGAGSLGINQTTFTINNVFSANAGSTLDIDVTGGNGGLGGGGVGTGNNSGLLNNSTIQATGGSSLSFEGGLYENAAGGVMQALAGSAINLNSDSRILNGTLTTVGTGVVNAHGVTQYLSNVTLSSGSNLDVNSDNLYLNTTFTNNGTVKVSVNSNLLNETGTLAINGAGTVILDSSGGYARIYGGNITVGAGETVQGAGSLGINQTIFTNNGLISANVATGGIDIDVTGGNGGVGAGNGVGTGGNAGLYNTGTMQATGGSTLSIEGGLYENSATGTMAALTGSTVVMNSDASLFNLQAGGVLNKGVYVSNTGGAASTLDLRSNAANGIATIGTGASGTDTKVALTGANSLLNVLNFGTDAPSSIDSTLTTVAQSGELDLTGRNMTIVAGGGAFTNNGIVRLAAGSAFDAASYANGGLTYGAGSVGVAISNTGVVEAAGGVLSTKTITGSAGVIRSDAGATLDLSGATANSSAGTLTNNGNLNIGVHNVVVTNDYANAAFGSGNAFNNHAHVAGTGLILASSGTMDLSGPALTGGTIDVGNVRTGGSSSTTLTITNNGASTNIVGAVQNTNAPSIAISNQDYAAAHGGGSATVTLSYTGTVAGSLAGQSITVVNNFDNIAPKTVGILGNVYQIAVAAAQPGSLTLAARRVGDAAATSGLTIANTAPNTGGFTESLSATAGVGGAFLVNGSGSTTVGPLGAGASAPVTVSLGTGTAGAFANAVTIANTSIPVAGSGFSNLALAGQTVTVTGNVYAAAVANLSGNTVNFGAVRQGGGAVTANLTLANGAVGSLADVLNTTATGLPSGVSAATPGPLAAGQSANVGFTLGTATAGVVSGSGALNFTSTDAQLAPLTLASQNVAFTGTVTQLAQALLSKDAGTGIFTGGGSAYTLHLGTFTAGQSTSADLGVTNNIPNSAFAEMLGGSFAHSGPTAFSFTGASFSGLAGGSIDTGNLLGFNSTGLSTGLYAEIITFNGFSRFPGLSDYTFGPITVTVDANVIGGTGGVPEPATWAMMLVGVGLIGGALRRRHAATLNA